MAAVAEVVWPVGDRVTSWAVRVSGLNHGAEFPPREEFAPWAEFDPWAELAPRDVFARFVFGSAHRLATFPELETVGVAL